MTKQNNNLNLQLEVFEPEEIELNVFKALAAFVPSTSSLSAEQVESQVTSPWGPWIKLPPGYPRLLYMQLYYIY